MNSTLKILIYLVIILIELSFYAIHVESSVRERKTVIGDIERLLRFRRDLETKVENENLYDIKSGVIVEEVEDDDLETTTRKKIIEVIVPGNDLMIGNCSEHDQMLYIDNTVINNDGPSILNGTIEVYIDTTSPIKITCVHIVDQIKDGTGGMPSLNSGGVGFNWVKIDVQGQYEKGFHFKTYVFGVPDLDPNKYTTPTPMNRTVA